MALMLIESHNTFPITFHWIILTMVKDYCAPKPINHDLCQQYTLKCFYYPTPCSRLSTNEDYIVIITLFTCMLNTQKVSVSLCYNMEITTQTLSYYLHYP